MIRLLIVLGGFAGCVWAQSADTYAAALDTAKKKGRDLAVLVHGSDWNRPGEAFRRNVWDAKTFRDALGNGFAFFDVDVMESPSDDQKKRLAQRHKGFKTRFGTYPVLVLIDPRGERYAQVHGSAFPYEQAGAVAWLLERRRSRERRDDCLKRAAEANAAGKADWLFRAAEADAGRRAEIIKRLKAADPEDAAGYVAFLTFNGTAALRKAVAFAGKKTFEEGVTWFQQELARKGLRDAQRQWLYAGLGNLYRRWPGHNAEAHRAFMDGCELDPDSVAGRACQRIARRFVGPPTPEYGWEPRHCSTEETTWKIDPGKAFAEPGTYEVVFAYRRGKSGLSIASVALLDGERVVSQDEHEGFAGKAPKDAAYRVTVTADLASPVLSVRCRTGPDANSAGEINVRRLVADE